jgi:hypothetical protein
MPSVRRHSLVPHQGAAEWSAACTTCKGASTTELAEWCTSSVCLATHSSIELLCTQRLPQASIPEGHAPCVLTSYLRIWCQARSLTPLWMATTLLMSPGSAGQPLRRMAL